MTKIKKTIAGKGKSDSVNESSNSHGQEIKEICYKILEKMLSEIQNMDASEIRNLITNSIHQDPVENPKNLAQPSNAIEYSEKTSYSDSNSSPKNMKKIIASALTMFLDNGYDISMDKIAEKAGVTKRTIYSHFTNKEMLFKASVESLRSEMTSSVLPKSSGNIYQELLAFSLDYRAVVLCEREIKAYRLITTPLKDVPELGLAGYSFLNDMITSVSTYFEDAMQSGKIRKMDSKFLAEQFLTFILGNDRSRILMNIEPKRGDDEDDYLQQSLKVFVKGIEI